MLKKWFVSVLFFGCSSAQAGFECVSTDGRADLELNFHSFATVLTLRSSDMQLYYHVAYNADLGRLELIRELDGNRIINATPTGYHALLTAPNSGLSLVWDFEMKFQSPLPTERQLGEVLVTDPSGHSFQFQMQCRSSVDFKK